MRFDLQTDGEVGIQSFEIWYNVGRLELIISEQQIMLSMTSVEKRFCYVMAFPQISQVCVHPAPCATTQRRSKKDSTFSGKSPLQEGFQSTNGYSKKILVKNIKQ